MPKTKKYILNVKWEQRLYFYSLLFFAVLLPFQPIKLPLTLGLMLYSAVWLITLQFGTKLKLLAKNKMASLCFAYFLWIVIGAIYSPEKGEAIKDMVLKVPFAVWPILIGSVALFGTKNREQLVKAFIVALAVGTLFNFILAFVNYASTGDSQYFYFSKLIVSKLIPPHYFGMYLNMTYGILLLGLLQKNYLFKKQYWQIVLLAICVIGVIFAAVRMQYIVFIAITLFVFFRGYHHKSIGKKMLAMLGLVAAMLGLSMAFPGSRARLNDTVNEFNSRNEMVNSKQTNHRKFIWTEGLEVIKQNWLFGTGTAAADPVLNARLYTIEATFWNGESTYKLRDKKYNYHNAYLQHWAAHGLIGLILLAAIFVAGWRNTPDLVPKIFLLVCALSFITESMLERQAGVLFFSFFYTLFFILKPKKEVTI